MNKPHRKSANQSRRSSGRSVMSNQVRSENAAEARVISDINIPPADIPKIQWHEILDNAEEDLIVNHIREEIIRHVMEVIYNRHLEKTSYAFVVHCSYLAWMQFFDLLYLKHDPGESVQTIAENWPYDKAPDPVPVDPWACRRMTFHEVEKKPEESESCTASCSTKIAEVESAISVSSFTYPFPEDESCIELSTKDVLAGKPQGSKLDIITDGPSLTDGDRTSSASLSQSQRSIFTRTISVVKADLPVTRWQSQEGSNSKDHDNYVKDKTSRTIAEAVPPEPLDLQTLPSDRIDVKYVIIPEKNSGSKSQGQKSGKTRRGFKK